MSAAERMQERNDIILTIRDIDDRLTALYSEQSYRSAAECRELLDIRNDQCATLIALGGQPGPAPLVAVPA